MPNLVGIGNSQVPTNAMLGGLAYQDSAHAVLENVEIENIAPINKKVGMESPYAHQATGEVVLVYDTKNDSDGGAWRKKCSHTSWYNEDVGKYRGGRKEFPSVAIIVIGQVRVTIYDGDDPNLSMWMQFNANGAGYMIGCNSDYPSCVTALNGTIVIGEHENYGGVVVLNFIKDTTFRVRGSTTTNGTHGWWPTGIVGRNGTDESGGLFENSGRGYDNTDVGTLVSDDVSSVAIKASSIIDPVTDFPIPIIACGCDTGVSIITPEWHINYDMFGKPLNASIIDITSSNGSYTQGRSVEWNEHGDLIFVMGDGNGDADYLHSFNGYPHRDNSITHGSKTGAVQNVRTIWRGNYNHGSPGVFDQWFSQGSNYANTDNTHQHKTFQVVTKKGYEYAVRTRNGLTHILENTESSGNGMVSYATTTFATGWLVGKDKLSVLTDTDDTNISYATIVDNWATAGAWTFQNQQISLSSSGSGTSGTVSITHGDGGGSYVYAYLPITVEENTEYVVTATFGAYLGSDLFISPAAYNASNKVIDFNQAGLYKGGHFNSGSNTTLYFHLNQNNTTATTLTGLVIQKVIEEDRSVHTKGLQVYGTITKEPVERGADLVCYSGWSTNNYLYQPPGTLNYGTGDFSFYFWIQPQTSSAGKTIFSLSDRPHTGSTTDASNLYCYFNGDDIRVDLSGPSVTYQGFQAANYPHPMDFNAWLQVFIVKRGNALELWLNGKVSFIKSLDSNQFGKSFSNDQSVLRIGHDSNVGGADGNIKLALFRSSGTAPSPYQIRKMYDDELPLFQKDAKCTLVSATNDHNGGMSYDKNEDILYVGGKGGRADFMGLQRINNNTTEVTRGVSASNGLVVEY